jgi:hypothetical protein
MLTQGKNPAFSPLNSRESESNKKKSKFPSAYFLWQKKVDAQKVSFCNGLFQNIV